MLTRNLLFRITAPSLLVSLLFLGSCIIAAFFAQHRRSASLRELDAGREAHRIAAELLGDLADLSSLSGGCPEAADILHERVGAALALAGGRAGPGEGARLVGRLDEGFGRYLRARRGAPPEADGREALALLNAEVVPTARDLERLHAAAVARSEASLNRAVEWMAWGLVGVGVVGTLTAILSGYVVARGLGRTVLRAGELAEVGQIAAGMAHELRNPLTSIKMLVQVDRERAERSGLPSEDLFAIEQEIRRMEDRLNAFMDFARPPRPERRRIDLVPVVERTIALVGGRARKQRVELHFDRPAVPVPAEADGEQLQQLLVNLALNALDVMPRGGILEIELTPPADGQVELRVLDSGPGIPPGHLARLYEPFFTSKETGLGLGLAVSQRIARDHGGRLRAYNRPEGGAGFVLRLPVPDARESGHSHG